MSTYILYTSLSKQHPFIELICFALKDSSSQVRENYQNCSTAIYALSYTMEFISVELVTIV